MTSFIDALRAEIDNEDSEFIKNLTAKGRVRQSQIRKIGKYLESLSDKELDKIVIKFLEWEKKYENMWFKKYINKSSLIFTFLTEYTFNHGEIVLNPKYEDFLASEHEWRGYNFKLYMGQGSVWRITKDDKILFQTA